MSSPTTESVATPPKDVQPSLLNKLMSNKLAVVAVIVIVLFLLFKYYKPTTPDGQPHKDEQAAEINSLIDAINNVQ